MRDALAGPGPDAGRSGSLAVDRRPPSPVPGHPVANRGILPISMPFFVASPGGVNNPRCSKQHRLMLENPTSREPPVSPRPRRRPALLLLALVTCCAPSNGPAGPADTTGGTGDGGASGGGAGGRDAAGPV